MVFVLMYSGLSQQAVSVEINFGLKRVFSSHPFLSTVHFPIFTMFK
jgi:hypothetical protein